MRLGRANVFFYVRSPGCRMSHTHPASLLAPGCCGSNMACGLLPCRPGKLSSANPQDVLPATVCTNVTCRSMRTMVEEALGVSFHAQPEWNEAVRVLLNRLAPGVSTPHVEYVLLLKPPTTCFTRELLPLKCCTVHCTPQNGHMDAAM